MGNRPKLIGRGEGKDFFSFEEQFDKLFSSIMLINTYSDKNARLIVRVQVIWISRSDVFFFIVFIIILIYFICESKSLLYFLKICI